MPAGVLHCTKTALTLTLTLTLMLTLTLWLKLSLTLTLWLSQQSRLVARLVGNGVAEARDKEPRRLRRDVEAR